MDPEGTNSFLKGFYQPFVDMIDLGTSTRTVKYDGRSFVTSELLDHVRIGLDKKINDQLARAPSGISATVESATRNPYANNLPNEVWVNRNGISVELETGWASGDIVT